MKNLSEEDIETLERKLQEAIDDKKSFYNLVNFHGAPETICPETPDGYCCKHGDGMFLPWHRLYMVNFEEMLDEALPYWDWTEDTERPKLWENIKVQFKEGAQSVIRPDGREASSGLQDPSDPDSFITFPACPQGDPSVVRRPEKVEWNAPFYKKLMRKAYQAEDYTTFTRDIIRPHNLVHVNSGCEMGDTGTASYDPIFWLNHANVDRQLAIWEELQKLRGNTEIGTFIDIDLKLAPFDDEKFNNVSMTFDNSQSRDVFDYKEKFCYEYDDLTFDGKTPQELVIDPQADSINILQNYDGCSNQHPNSEASCPKLQFKILVGVVMPKYVASNLHTFKICQDKVCVPGFTIATFGSGKQKILENRGISKKSHTIIYSDVTETVNSKGWDPEKVYAEMTSFLVKGTPKPLVIIRNIKSSAEKIKLGPQQRAEDYGDLMDGYSVN